METLTLESNMTLVTQPGDFNTQLAELDKIQDTCKKLLQTSHYKKLGEEGIHAIISRAKALGIHPFEALNGGFHCINGKVGMSTEMMAALVRQKGHSITKDPKSNNELCILKGKRADNGDEWTCSFSKEDAMAAGLWGGPTWKKYPAIMLYNRCMSMLFRQLFPDLSLGAGYVEDELKEIQKVGEYAKRDDSLLDADFEDVTPKKEEVVPKITAEQDAILRATIKKLTEEQKKGMAEWLSKKGYSDICDIPADKYNFIKDRADAICKTIVEIVPSVNDSEVPF